MSKPWDAKLLAAIALFTIAAGRGAFALGDACGDALFGGPSVTLQLFGGVGILWGCIAAITAACRALKDSESRVALPSLGMAVSFYGILFLLANLATAFHETDGFLKLGTFGRFMLFCGEHGFAMTFVFGSVFLWSFLSARNPFVPFARVKR